MRILHTAVTTLLSFELSVGVDESNSERHDVKALSIVEETEAGTARHLEKNQHYYMLSILTCQLFHCSQA